MALAPAALLAALLLPSTAAAPDAGGGRPAERERYAIVVGYNGPADGERPQLSFADDDAARFFLQVYRSSARAWLLTTFDKESAQGFPTLVDQAAQPSRRELARALGEAAWLIRRARREGKATELVFFFAGHGDVSAGGEGFVVLADGPFTRTDLGTQVVEGSPAELNHVLIDACASYFMVPRGEGAASSERVEVGPALLETVRGAPADALERTGFLVSTSAAAEVHESAEVGGGVFSYLLRSAVAGGADANGDGRIEYAETAAFIAAASESIDDPRAKLAVFAQAPAQRPHAPLVDLSSSGIEHFLVVDERAGARIRVLDSRGVPYAEVHRTEGGPRLLALAGHPFFVVQRGAEEAVLVPRSAGGYALSSLQWEDRPSKRSATLAAGPFAGLFDVAYGDAFLRGFLTRSDLVAPRPGPALQIAYAEGAEPPFRIPWWTLAGTSFAGAAVLAAGAAVAAVGNLLSFVALQQAYLTTGTLDPRYAVLTDAWLTAAGALAVGAVGASVVGGGLTFLALQEEAE